MESRVEAIEVRPESWDDKVGELVRTLLPGGNCTIETIAEHLACDRRTVHRRLLECCTTFSAILVAERSDEMMRLVEDGKGPLKELARLLGFRRRARWRAGFAANLAAASANGAPTSVSGR